MTDTLSLQGIEPYLREKAAIHIYPSLESTNDTAKNMHNPAHGTVIIADYQTAGRGRHGRSFFSPTGCGIYMSVVLHPKWFWPDNLALITPMAAVAVCEAIEATTRKAPQIKWVNDIFLNGKKICGILTETVMDASGEISHIVVGIGINFTTPPGGFPPEIAQTAGTLFGPEGEYPLVGSISNLSPTQHCNYHNITRNQLIAEIINRILSPENTHQRIIAEYKKRLLVLQRRVSVVSTDTAYEATALDIDAQGGLIVQKDNGEILTLTTGEVYLSGRCVSQ